MHICKADGSGYGTCQGCPNATSGQGGGLTTSSSMRTSTSGTGSSTVAGSSTSTCAGGPTDLDMHQVTLYSNPPDLADWPMTTSLTEVDFTTSGVHVAFSKQDGSGRWPDVVPPGWSGSLQYTLGMVECINGQWYGSAVIEFWYGLDASGGNIAAADQVAVNWYYDAGRWGLLAGRQPATGETIGIFVAAGNLRNITTDDPQQSPVMERSDVVLVPMPDTSGAQHSF